MKKLSIIVPVYYNAESLLPLYNDLREKVLNKQNIIDGMRKYEHRISKTRI